MLGTPNRIMIQFLFMLASLATVGTFIWAAGTTIMVWWHLDANDGPSETTSRPLQAIRDALLRPTTDLMPEPLFKKFRLALRSFLVSLAIFGLLWLAIQVRG
jgi:hypothetical protein